MQLVVNFDYQGYILSKSLLLLIHTYNIAFFKTFFNISIKSNLRLEHTLILFAKSEFHTTDLFARLEQVSHNRFPVTTRVQLWHPTTRSHYPCGPTQVILTCFVFTHIYPILIKKKKKKKKSFNSVFVVVLVK